MPAGKPTLVAPTSDAELRALRRRCASALWALVPKGLGRLYFGGGLLRASPVSRARHDGIEGSAELKTAGKSERHSDRGRGPPSKEKASEVEMVPPLSPARGQERLRSGSRSRRSAPVPRPKTGGQGLAANVSVSADPPITPATVVPSSSSETASAGEEVDGGMASTRLTQQDENGWHPDWDREANPDDDDDDDEGILEEIERGILDVFSNSYCNKHLVYGMLELVLVRLLPELTEKGVLELWTERIPIDG
ncbi:hypothetical protein N657DRAFT_425804 [Parathielavia appendiculata]|uniref:Uncharacterized protein n=1 Tax=Parathielavia appendiculata TaxID=2587402 RepID=A0AAN6U070_9PEZI|nr:hypothetical protein N657DRAFT_425804 [Parathielavia appendiculata]